MIPVLVMYTDFVALMGAFINVNANELVSMSTFFAQVFSSVTFLDIFSSIIKSLFFGFTIGMVGCYKGYTSSKGTEGVGRAANAAVVVSMFLIFIEELLSLQIINLFRIK
jgi:phospholipid/cholesterol/gamma-HCH transport system permease protein